MTSTVKDAASAVRFEAPKDEFVPARPVTETDGFLPRDYTPNINHGGLTRSKIMIVDDEPVNIRIVQKHLGKCGYERFVTTTDSREAMGLMKLELPDLVILDLSMPHINGIELLESIRQDKDFFHVPVLILTADTRHEMKVAALDWGATDFLSKPIEAIELSARIRNALMLKRHHDQLSSYSEQLELEVRRRTAELAESREEIIRVLACAAEYRDKETGNHVLRVGRYAGIIARQLGLSRSRVDIIEQASILHDVGKIGIPDAILLKPGKLTDTEYACIRRHCSFGVKILLGMSSHANAANQTPTSLKNACNSPILKMAAVIAASHHERWEGGGYPRGLAGEAIPIEGRITAVADVFDALSSRRPYKDPMPLDQCFEMLENDRGRQFDPAVLDAFLARTEEVVRVSLELSDD